MFHTRVDREKLNMLLQTQPANFRAGSQQFTCPNGQMDTGEKREMGQEEEQQPGN